MLRKISLLWNTVRHLKARQIIFQLYYRFNKVKKLSHYRDKNALTGTETLHFSGYLPAIPCAEAYQQFTFLNQSVLFEKDIDWDYMDNGKLWNYNLHYANYILQEDLPLSLRLKWLSSLHCKLASERKGLEPYPVSLRLINTIRLIVQHNIKDQALLENVKAEARFFIKKAGISYSWESPS